MPSMDVVIEDAAGTRKKEVSVPDDVALARVAVRMVDILKMPLTAPTGEPMSYKFLHKETSKQLRDDATLSSSGVSRGDTLRLVPEITAG
jgi:WXG100 protein secretion system (Wss), protein YukD